MSTSRPSSKGLPIAKGTSTPLSTPPNKGDKVTTPLHAPKTPGTANSATKTPGSSGNNDIREALHQRLVMKMRAKFGDAAKDLKSQEVIGQEVAAFMSQVGGGGLAVKDADIGTLEVMIRAKLTGDEPPKMTHTLEKRAQIEGDEWAKIFQYNIQVGKTIAEAEAEANRHRQAQQRTTLKGQQQQIEVRKLKEKEEARLYFLEQEAALKAWKEDEEKKKHARLEVVKHVAEERKRQLEEKSERIRRAKELAEMEDREAAAKLAYEAQQELLKEERERVEAKEALTTFLHGNEANKKLREEAKKKEHDLDEKYAKEWNEIIERQEKERTARLEKAKELSKKHEATAMIRFQADGAVDRAKQEENDRILKERERKRNQEDEDRKKRLKEGALAAAATYSDQAKRKAEERRIEKEKDEAINRAIVERAAAEEKLEQEKVRRALEARLKLKSEIEEQMKDNAVRRRVAPMSEIEKKINLKLLVEIEEFKHTGKVSAASSPKVVG